MDAKEPSPFAAPAAASPPGAERHALPRLDPAAPSAAAVRLILASLAGAVRDHAEAVCRGDEPEAVHDLRVALRRARALLGPSRQILTSAEIHRLRGGVRWLGELSCPVRDLEVLLERLQSSRKPSSNRQRAELDALVVRVGRDHDRARRRLLAGLCGSRYRGLMDAWARITAPPGPPTEGEPAVQKRRSPAEAERPIGLAGAEAIDRAWRRLVRHGRALSDGSPFGAFHRVRIDGKKLRYLLELLRSAYPDVDLGPVIAKLKSLQDCLGDLNDARVQQDALREMAQRLAEERGATPEAFLLVDRLIERSFVAAATARRRYRDRFDALNSRDNRRRIRALADTVAASEPSSVATPVAEGSGGAG